MALPCAPHPRSTYPTHLLLRFSFFIHDACAGSPLGSQVERTAARRRRRQIQHPPRTCACQTPKQHGTNASAMSVQRGGERPRHDSHCRGEGLRFGAAAAIQLPVGFFGYRHGPTDGRAAAPTLADFAMHTNATHSCPPLSDEVQLSSCTPDLPRIALRADLPLLPTCPREQPRPPDPPGPSQDTTCLLRLCPFAGSSRTRRRISKLSQALHRRCVPKVIDFLRSATTCRWCHRD
mmetsp:Transcript_20805/g.64684  ORF Transcript_20805/g.64684 Transcript_20805/m.64684 type:complete len:235 (-) Transcript_20805:242-946(-)